MVLGRDAVIFSKHLCGAATDLTLRCAVNRHAYAHEPNSEACKWSDIGSLPGSVSAIMIALCCHHRCTWLTFVSTFNKLATALTLLIDKEFFTSLSFTPREFAYLCKMSRYCHYSCRLTNEFSWAVSGSSATNPTEVTVEGIKSPEIGLKCKRLLDFARAQYLEKHGYNVHLYYYVQKDITAENVLIVAKK